MAAEKWPPEIEKTAILDYILFVSEMVINRDQPVRLGPRISDRDFQIFLGLGPSRFFYWIPGHKYTFI